MSRSLWIFLLAGATLSVGADNASAGQFKPAVYYKVGAHDLPYYVIAAQLTASGNLDLVFADWLNSQVSILLGNGDGTFQKPLRFSVPGPVQVAAGDFNEDGNPDLAVLEFGGTGHSVLALFLGEGNGKFRKGATYRLGIQGSFFAVADFNGDGHLDMVETNGGEGNNPNMMVFFGTGKGTLKKSATYKVAGLPGSITTADLNGDHHPDVAIANGGSVDILLNDGTGKFKKPVSYKISGSGTADVKIADLRHDGNQDLVVADTAEGMVVLLNHGDGTFGKPTVSPPPPARTASVRKPAWSPISTSTAI